MKHYTLSSGHKIPAIGLGTWNAPDDVVSDAVKFAIENGYRHIDCAAIYLNEKAVGKAFHNVVQSNVVKRDELFITSKLWNSYHQPEQVLPALKNSLHDLQLDYLDLYLIHWPVAFKTEVGLEFPADGSDYLTLDEIPIHQTWQAMEELVAQGLVRTIGVSNFSAKKLTEMFDYAKIPPAVNQVECQPYFAQNELLTFCKQNNIHMTAYSPLGSAGRPETMKRDNEPSVIENPVLINIAEKHQATAAQVALAWQVQRGLSVIPKSSNPERLQQNLAAAKLQLDQDDMAAIAKLDNNFRYVDGSIFTNENSPYKVAEIWDE